MASSQSLPLQEAIRTAEDAMRITHKSLYTALRDEDPGRIARGVISAAQSWMTSLDDLREALSVGLKHAGSAADPAARRAKLRAVTLLVSEAYAAAVVLHWTYARMEAGEIALLDEQEAIRKALNGFQGAQNELQNGLADLTEHIAPLPRRRPSQITLRIKDDAG